MKLFRYQSQTTVKVQQLSKYSRTNIAERETTEPQSTVTNLSQHNLTKQENRILCQGLNFAITPKSNPRFKIFRRKNGK